MNARDKSREQLIQVDRRANSLNNELEECKMSLELADRLRRNAKQERLQLVVLDALTDHHQLRHEEQQDGGDAGVWILSDGLKRQWTGSCFSMRSVLLEGHVTRYLVSFKKAFGRNVNRL